MSLNYLRIDHTVNSQTVMDLLIMKILTTPPHFG
jgi:hypothetical protein